MTPIDCHLQVWSDDARLQQLYTGLTSLSRQGLIRLRQTIFKHPKNAGIANLQTGSAHAQLILNDSVKVFYDLADHDTLDPSLVASVDSYFKRSFDPAVVNELGPLASRIKPLGLNYPVFPNRPDTLSWRRACTFGSPRQRIQQCLRLWDLANLWSSLPREHHLSSPPNFEQNPRVLFLVRAWDPQDSPQPTPDKIQHYASVNQMRARCIRALRANFGDAFIGGFSHTSFAKRHFPDALASRTTQTSKRAYLQLLQDHSICVTSGGLHRSIGWKMGEYVALSKAIVTEVPAFKAPGPFSDGSHYLSYHDAEGCVAAVQRLIEDTPLRHTMMTQNRTYFLEYLKPDRLVANTFSIALGHPFGALFSQTPSIA